MRDRGWNVVTIDIDPRFKTDIVADATTFSWDGAAVDLLWASPPCDEFSRESMPWCRTGQIPSLELVHATLRIVGEVRPRWWVMENVRGLQRWFGRSSARFGPVYLWGWFPKFEAPERYWKETLSSTRHAERAKIPYEIGEALAVAIEESADYVPMPLYSE